MKDFNKACEELIANGGKKLENLEILDVKFDVQESYVKFILEFDFGTIYTANYALLSAMRRNANCNAFIAWYNTIENKDVANLALANELKNIHNHIDIIQQYAELSEDGFAHQINPFTDKEFVYVHPVVLNYIVNIY